MEKDEVKKLAELRNYVISYYKQLDNNKSTGVDSFTSTKEVASVCETVVKSMDDLLREFVSFKKEE
jgi:uncharacterized protein YutE (UPF0331/DUF86 family)